MGELTPRERLQPSLLDRLTDNEPQKQEESRAGRVLPLARLREAVIRDLGWLLNCTNLFATRHLEIDVETDLEKQYPLVADSVLNYGLPDLTGVPSPNVDLHDLSRRLRQAIMRFEPRILPDSVQVSPVPDSETGHHNSLMFEITGELWARPVPERLYLKTRVDLETGDFAVAENASGG